MFTNTGRSYLYSPTIVISFLDSTFIFKFRDPALLSNLTTGLLRSVHTTRKNGSFVRKQEGVA